MKPTQADAEKAVRTLLEWIGENPDREGLLETPKRVVKAFGEYFQGYQSNPDDVLQKTFAEIEDYDELVLVKDIDFISHCEHHMAPIIGKAHVAYLPKQRIVGLSKLARLVDIYARRLQTQELMTAQICATIEKGLTPHGTAVVIEAGHSCMSIRGVGKLGSQTITSKFAGAFKSDRQRREEVMALMGH